MTLKEVLDTARVLFYDVPLFTVQGHAITCSDLGKGVVVFAVFWIISKWCQFALIRRVLRPLDIERGVQYSFLRIIHYGVMIIGLYTAVTFVGIPLTGLLGVIAMLGIGIGFGLQGLANNFICGLILLLERPIKIGDRVTVDELWGDVVQVNLRTTVITTTDNVAVIIPNSKLMENNLINWSYGDPRIRIHIPIGVAYGSDVDRVTMCLLKVAGENERVLKEPAPEVWFKEFGESSLNLELVIWLPGPGHKDDAINEINRAIDRLFADENIEIPFPQRDLHLRSCTAPLRIVTAAELAKAAPPLPPPPPPAPPPAN